MKSEPLSPEHMRATNVTKMFAHHIKRGGIVFGQVRTTKDRMKTTNIDKTNQQHLSGKKKPTSEMMNPE